MGLFNINKKSLEHVLNYILESEHEDFLDNLGNNHIYYHALVCAKGKQVADDYLNERLEEQRQNE